MSCNPMAISVSRLALPMFTSGLENWVPPQPSLSLRLLRLLRREGSHPCFAALEHANTNVSSAHAVKLHPKGHQSHQPSTRAPQNVKKGHPTSHTSRNVDDQPRSPQMACGHRADLLYSPWHPAISCTNRAMKAFVKTIEGI